VELNKLDPSIKLDIRLRFGSEFLGSSALSGGPRVYARPVRRLWWRASQQLQQLGYGRLIHDSYRPWYVTKMFLGRNSGGEREIFVADPAQGSRHNRGARWTCAVRAKDRGADPHDRRYDEMSSARIPSIRAAHRLNAGIVICCDARWKRKDRRL